VFFHEQASVGFWIVLRIFTYILPNAFVNVFIVFSSIYFSFILPDISLQHRFVILLHRGKENPFPADEIKFAKGFYQFIFFPIEREWSTNVNRILNYTFNGLSLII